MHTQCRCSHTKRNKRQDPLPVCFAGGGLLLWGKEMLRFLEITAAVGTLITLIEISIKDWRTRKITDRSLVLLLLVGAVATYGLPVSLEERLLGIVLAGAPLLLIDLVLPGAFGGGDIKLSAVAGVLLGWRGGLLALGAGFLTGGLYGAVMLATGRFKRKDRFAFGPFICLGIILCFCCFIFVNSQ